MKATDTETVLNIISDLELTKDTQKTIANRYNVSESLVEKINRCKIYSGLHSYNNNIRREANDLNINVINTYYDFNEVANICILEIIRTDKQKATTLISYADYNKISKYNWTFRIDSNGDCRIRATSNELHGQDLSTWLLNGTNDMVVDHINRDTLDNRRENLRLVSRSMNSINAKARIESKTNIRGVYKRIARPGIAKESWVCEWSDSTGRHSKSFSCEKYGEEEAFRLAKSLREEKMKEMKI